MVALLTALAILFASFVHPPMPSPGVSISKAAVGDADTPVAEHASRDAEEDAAGEHDNKTLGAAAPAAVMPLAPQAGCRREGLPPHVAWPPAGQAHGLHAVRGPPA